MNKMKKYCTKGFTMIEIMVVVVIVAILAAVAVPIYIDYVESARASEAKSVIGSITNGAKMYRQTYGEWPGDVEEIERAGQLNIDRATKRQWIFEIQMPERVLATSTSEMEGGEGKVVEYNAETGQYTGYGTKKRE